MVRRVEPDRQERFVKLRGQGYSRASAAKLAGVSVSWANKFELAHADTGDAFRQKAQERAAGVTGAVPLDRLCEDAAWALHDFEHFRRFYLGHVSTPWQVEAAEKIVELLGTPFKEFVVLNCPPGTGKTTLIHDIACWLTVRDRSVRGLIGTRKANNGERMLRRIRRSLERPLPFKASDEDIALGLACDAGASLPQHYGRFKPDNGDVWRAAEFVVEQFDQVAIEEKEPTWSSYGVDSGVLGNRFNVIFWDDLVDRTNTRTVDTRQELELLWDNELETRLEPGGLLVLLGQRLAGGDLYGYCRSKTIDLEDDDDDDEDVGDTETGLKYHRIVYQAHDETKCTNRHKAVEPWPASCLLDPHRLPWRDLRRIRKDIYEVSYQQRDVDPASVLVNPIWVKGGRDKDGIDHPGCWDADRGLDEAPLVGAQYTSVLTVDPSPTKFWSVQWWITPMDPATPLESRVRYLMDVYRQKMTAPEFMYAEPVDTGRYQFSGMAEAWRARAQTLGFPLTHIVIEENAAQRFFTQQPYFRSWCNTHHIQFRPHQTHRNKNDPTYGVSSLATVWRYGLVRLPGKGPARTTSLKLVDEVQKWPGGSTDDCVMAHWFHEVALPHISVIDPSRIPTAPRPSWMQGATVEDSRRHPLALPVP